MTKDNVKQVKMQKKKRQKNHASQKVGLTYKHMPRVSRLKLPPPDLEKSAGERLAQLRKEKGFT